MDALILIVAFAALPFALFTAFWAVCLLLVGVIHVVCWPLVLIGIIPPENMRS